MIESKIYAQISYFIDYNYRTKIQTHDLFFSDGRQWEI